MQGSESDWREAYGAAQRAWPGVTLGFERFMTHAAEVGFSPQGAPTEPDGSHGPDLFLATACGDGDRPAIGALEHRYMDPTRSSLKRLDPRPEFIDDVMQELRTKLLVPPEPRILRYGARGPLLAWIRVAASRIAIDSLRSVREPVLRQPRDPDALEGIDFGPEVQLLRAAYRESFQDALSTTLAGLSAQDRNLLRRHLVQRMTWEEIAGPYRLHPATVARRLMALREQIATAVRAHLAGHHRSEGGATSMESMAAAIRSEVYVSLAPLLAGASVATDDEPNPE
jgi:RNA polymerase sigma-70 factor (ECF subfamily)